MTRFVPIVLVLFLWNCSTVLCHKEIAGSCNSPRGDHLTSSPHGKRSRGNGGYTLTVEPHREAYSAGEEVVLVLNYTANHETFRGFQIICEECEFPDIESNTEAQINRRYCRHPGRISHTNNHPKERVEIKVKLPLNSLQDLVIDYYVVKSVKDWYGPMKLILPMSLSSSMNPTNRTNSPPSTMLQSTESKQLCKQSNRASYDCMAELANYFKIHWSLHNEEDSNSTNIDISIEAKTKGWASLAFAKIKGRMHPADAALGWIHEDGHHHQQAYHIVEDDIHESNANASLLEVKSISREGDWLFIDFVKIEKSGLVAIDLDEDVFLNYAIGKENALREHNKYGSVVISFTTGEIHTASFRKYYQVHGALMIIAWIALIPLAILIARSRWAPLGMGKRGWLDLHKGIQVFVVICVFCALLIALINFQPIESKKGRMHRLVGILTSILLAIQVLAGIFHPSVEHELRPIFNVAHAWSGRCLALLAVISVFLGISAFHHTTHSSIVTWVVCVVLLMTFHIVLTIFIEVKLRQTFYMEGEEGERSGIQLAYTRPELNDEYE